MAEPKIIKLFLASSSELAEPAYMLRKIKERQRNTIKKRWLCGRNCMTRPRLIGIKNWWACKGTDKIDRSLKLPLTRYAIRNTRYAGFGPD
jgi:hypothetical protein